MDDFDGFDLVDLDPVSIVAQVALKAAVKTVFNKGIEAYENMTHKESVNHEEKTIITVKEITLEEAKSLGIIDEEGHVITKECTIEDLLGL